jgi:thiol peroxidase
MATAAVDNGRGAEDTSRSKRSAGGESEAIMSEEQPGATTLRGNPLTLAGKELRPGDPAPDFKLIPAIDAITPIVTGALAPLRLSDLRGKVVLLSCVPSLNTQVCSLETRRWEQEQAKLGGQVELLTVSMDLPFAQAQWCAMEDVQHRTASAHMSEQFGVDYGVLVKELRLLARAVFVIGKDGRVKHAQYVKELIEEPDYGRLIEAAKQAAAE